MAHRTTIAVFVVLLLCSASLGVSTGTEYNVMMISTDSHGDKQDDVNMIKELKKEMTKYQRARKMGASEIKKDSAETGMATKTEMKPMGSSPKDATQDQPGANQNLEPHSTDDEVNEILNMLKRDYHRTARRRGPINNAIPLDDEEP